MSHKTNSVVQSGSFQIINNVLKGKISYVLQSDDVEFLLGKNLVSSVLVEDKNGKTVVNKTNDLWFNLTERDELININEYLGDVTNYVTVILQVFDFSTGASISYSKKVSKSYKVKEPEPEPCESGKIRVDGACLEPCERCPELCINGKCVENKGTKRTILNQTFVSGEVDKPVTHVEIPIDIILKGDEKILFSRIFTKVDATRISFTLYDMFHTSLVNVNVNNERVGSMNLEQDLFVNGKTKTLDKETRLNKGKNIIKFDLDYGQAGLQYNVFSDILVKVSSGRTITIKVGKKEITGTGGVKPFDIGLGLLPIALGLVAIAVLSTSGGRTIVYKGAKAGYKRLRKR